MNIEKILEEIDVLYSQQKVEEVEALLEEKIEELKKENAVIPAISLMNELLGIYREKGDEEKGKILCDDLLNIFSANQLPEDEDYGTTLLNIATACRAFGDFDRARNYYQRCLEIYQGKVPETDYRYASLYNNMSLLYSEMGLIEKAKENLQLSLEILKHHKNMQVPTATGNTTMAQLYMMLGNLEKAQEHIELALGIFSKVEDYHYSAALATAADIEHCFRNYEDSALLYEKAMAEMDKYLGRTENYRILEENLTEVQQLQKEKLEKDVLIAKIVEVEWHYFDKVQGIDGRATCQDDAETFRIMRSTQFSVWSMEMNESYLRDLEQAHRDNRNMIEEKYAYMMESTDPENFVKLKEHLPAVPEEKKKIIEKIISLQLPMVISIQEQYPKFGGQGRSLHSSEDSIHNTSYETYMRGDLCTYSDKTLGLYLDMVENHIKEGVNTGKLYMEEVAYYYGYPNLDAVEASFEEEET